MRFQILSHAGLRVQSHGKELLVDPWLLGSCYWRSWWNYPAPSKELLADLHPDAIYITHIHWDHFHGPSLKRFPKNTRIYIPSGPYSRMRRDLRSLGFQNVVELQHGECAELAPDFKITSYHFWLFLDSALVIESDGVTLFDANDAKFMGLPLDQIIKRHPKIDFTFRSHSSANPRICFEVVDDENEEVDDEKSYIQSFAAFAQKSGCRYAIPFASNHCFLHKDVFGLNHTIKTPVMVKEYFDEHHIHKPELVTMLSGDSWDREKGFAIDSQGERFFSLRPQVLESYAETNAAQLKAFYEREERAQLKLDDFQRFFKKFASAIPWVLRWPFINQKLRLFSKSNAGAQVFEVDLYRGRVTSLPEIMPAQTATFEIHTGAWMLKQSFQLNMLGHLQISKRVKYKVTRNNKWKMSLLNILFHAHEFEVIPSYLNFRPKALKNWAYRWREIILYGQIVVHLLFGRKFKLERYLVGS